MDELQQHREIVKARLAEQKLSVVELRREARVRHEQLLDPSYAADRETVIAEIEVLDQIIQSQLPPPVSPEELVKQLPESDPRRSALEHTLQRHQLAQDVADAQAYLEQHPTSDRAKQSLQEAQERLEGQPMPGFAQDMTQAREFRNKAELLQQQTRLATTDEERDQIQAEAESFFAKARALESNKPPVPAPAIPDQPPAAPDPVAVAESLVDAMQAAE